MARIEGTGIKAPSGGSQKMAKVYYGGPEAEKRRQLKISVKPRKNKASLLEARPESRREPPA